MTPPLHGRSSVRFGVFHRVWLDVSKTSLGTDQGWATSTDFGSISAKLGPDLTNLGDFGEIWAGVRICLADFRHMMPISTDLCSTSATFIPDRAKLGRCRPKLARSGPDVDVLSRESLRASRGPKCQRGTDAGGALQFVARASTRQQPQRASWPEAEHLRRA